MAEKTEGEKTSEHKKLGWIQYAGQAVALIGTLATAFAGVLPESNPWAGVVMAVVGLLTALAAALGYKDSRTKVKTEAIKANAALGLQRMRLDSEAQAAAKKPQLMST